jgi:GGDEF domain-containing protein
MSLQGPMVVVADCSAVDIVDALRAAGAFPVVEASWADAAGAVASIHPEALVLADRWSEPQHAQALAEQIEASDGPLIPIIARTREDVSPALPDALPVAFNASADRIVGKVNATLRIRAMHATVMRRTHTLASKGELPPEMPIGDPLEDATVLVTGRGRSYPGLSVAIGERVGIIGALSVESAARMLNARDIDGVVIGDGFSSRIVEALLTVLAEGARFRDLPVAVLGGVPVAIDAFGAHLPHLERLSEGPARLIERFLPFVRLHAFDARLKRMLASLDAEGMIDPDTGLLSRTAFWRDLNRAVEDAENRSIGLSIARFSFEGIDRRASVDAARLVSRLVRNVDFACREADNSIFAVFTETDLRAAHVVARRIASVLKHTMLASDRDRSGIDPAVTLATLKSADNVESLISRVTGAAMATVAAR